MFCIMFCLFYSVFLGRISQTMSRSCCRAVKNFICLLNNIECGRFKKRAAETAVWQIPQSFQSQYCSFHNQKKTIDEPSTVAMLATCGIFAEMYNFGKFIMRVLTKHSELHRKSHVLCYKMFTYGVVDWTNLVANTNITQLQWLSCELLQGEVDVASTSGKNETGSHTKQPKNHYRSPVASRSNLAHCIREE